MLRENICPEVYSVYGLAQEFTYEQLSSNKYQGKDCNSMCLVCFDNDAKPIKYERIQVLIPNRRPCNFYEEKTKRDKKPKQVINNGKHDSASEKPIKKILKGLKVIEEI